MRYAWPIMLFSASTVITVVVTPGAYPDARLTCYEPGIAHPSTIEAAPVPPTLSDSIRDSFQGLGLS